MLCKTKGLRAFQGGRNRGVAYILVRVKPSMSLFGDGTKSDSLLDEELGDLAHCGGAKKIPNCPAERCIPFLDVKIIRQEEAFFVDKGDSYVPKNKTGVTKTDTDHSPLSPNPEGLAKIVKKLRQK